MPTIITATQLRDVLGVSENLFDDEYLDQIIDTAEGVILPMLQELETGDYSDDARVQSAIYTVSVEVFQSRVAPGGQIEGVDFTPSPFRMGRSLWNRVSGLLGALVDVDTIAQ